MVRDTALNVELQAQERNCGLRAIASRRKEVFIVRMHDGRRADHAILFDANAGIGLHAEESHIFLLSDSSLRRCGRPSTRRVRIQDVRVVEHILKKRAPKRDYSQVADVIDVDVLPAPRRPETN